MKGKRLLPLLLRLLLQALPRWDLGSMPPCSKRRKEGRGDGSKREIADLPRRLKFERLQNMSEKLTFMESKITCYLEGGCYAIFGCSHHTDEYLEEIHTAIMKCLASFSEGNLSTNTRRLPNGDIKLSYSIYSSSPMTTVKEALNKILPCDEPESLYRTCKNPEKNLDETKPPNYPHLVIWDQPIQIVKLNSIARIGTTLERRWSLS